MMGKDSIRAGQRDRNNKPDVSPKAKLQITVIQLFNVTQKEMKNFLANFLQLGSALSHYGAPEVPNVVLRLTCLISLCRELRAPCQAGSVCGLLGAINSICKPQLC